MEVIEPKLACGSRFIVIKNEVGWISSKNGIIVLAARLEKDCDCIIMRQNSNCERMVIKLEKIISGQVMQFEYMIYEESTQIGETHRAGYRTHLIKLGSFGDNIVRCTMRFSGICCRIFALRSQ